MRYAFLLGAAALALQGPTIASAQETEADDSAGLAEIVVTAQRREENLQRAAIAVSAVTGAMIEEQSITQATDLTRLVPALQVAPASSLTQIYLRGVGTFGANAWAEQGVAFNYSGVYLSRPAAPAGLFYDLERLEVLKGPQGTLYGRNATGGALNVIPAPPDLGDFAANLTAEYGDYETFKASGALNMPLGDAAAFRIAAQTAQHEGYFNDGYDDEDTQAVRGQFRLQPNAAWDITIGADYAHVGGMGSGGTIMPLLFGDDDDRLGPSDPRVIAAYVARAPTPPVPQIIAQDDGYQDNEFLGVQANVETDLGFATLTLIPAWRRTDLDFLGYAPGFLVDVTELSEQSSMEIRLANQGERVNWVLGAYYFDEDVGADQLFDQASNATLIQSELSTQSTAIFGQATFSLTDAFRLTGGVRWTSDNKQQTTYTETRPFVGFVNPPINFTPIFLTIPSNSTSDIDFEETTWKIGLEYDVAPQSLLYASVATGFKSGILYAGTGRNYSDPEQLTAYTIGSKNRFFDNSLQFNVEAFYWDYTDQQVSHLGPAQIALTPGGPIYGPIFLTENAGAATIYGAEFELLWQVGAHGLFSANLQYLHSEYDSFEYQAYSPSGVTPVIGCAVTPTTLVGASPLARIFDVDCTGRPLANAPEWTLNAGYEHRFELGGAGRIIAAVDTRLEDERFLSIDYLPEGTQGSYMMSNLRVTWENEPGDLAVTGFLNNIENELVFSNSLQSPAKPGVVYNQIRPPRVAGVRLSMRF
ncbi:MAG: TonB-dependent receptor [Hydrogenophilaceae bacterium]|nr:TonB-dependent receptor [Hydrogenophilaceae bacterium]